MKYAKIPGTDQEVSVISLGSWVFGSKEWGGSKRSDCIEAIHEAVGRGINLIDTAPFYGDGQAEEIIGEGLSALGNANVIVATKCGVVRHGSKIKICLKKESMEKELHQSLKRLCREVIDIYQCHWPDTDTPIEETMDAMKEFQKQGKIKYIGVSNFDLVLLKRASQYADIKIAQEHYSYLERNIEKELLPFCREKGIGVLSYGSLGGGILTGKYKKAPSFARSDARSFFYKFYENNSFQESVNKMETLRKLADDYKKPLSQTALNWIISHQGILSAIVGCRSPQQVQENSISYDWEFSPDDADKIRSGLI